MSTVEEITAAIEQLSAADVARVRAWLLEYAERLWDEPLERDEVAGRLDALIGRRGGTWRRRADSPLVNHHTTTDLCKPRPDLRRPIRPDRLSARRAPYLAASTALHARIGSMTWPWTSVSRRSMPLWRKVSRVWSMPSRCRIVAWRS